MMTELEMFDALRNRTPLCVSGNPRECGYILNISVYEEAGHKKIYYEFENLDSDEEELSKHFPIPFQDSNDYVSLQDPPANIADWLRPMKQEEFEERASLIKSMNQIKEDKMKEKSRQDALRQKLINDTDPSKMDREIIEILYNKQPKARVDLDSNFYGHRNTVDCAVVMSNIGENVVGRWVVIITGEPYKRTFRVVNQDRLRLPEGV